VSSASPSDASLLPGSTMASRRAARGHQGPPRRRLVSVGTKEILLDGGRSFGRGRGRVVSAELLVDVAHPSTAYVQVDGDPGLRPVVTRTYPDDTVEPLGVIRRHDPSRASTQRDPDPVPAEVRFERPFRRYGIGVAPTPIHSPDWA
jgi:hypothetical protein